MRKGRTAARCARHRGVADAAKALSNLRLMGAMVRAIVVCGAAVRTAASMAGVADASSLGLTN